MLDRIVSQEVDRPRAEADLSQTGLGRAVSVGALPPLRPIRQSRALPFLPALRRQRIAPGPPLIPYPIERVRGHFLTGAAAEEH